MVSTISFAAAAASCESALPVVHDNWRLEEASKISQYYGRYENRLRLLSPPEKLFHYFASVQKDGEWFMTSHDFLRAVSPYSYHSDAHVGSSNPKYNTNRISPTKKREARKEYIHVVKQICKQTKNGDICHKLLRKCYILRSSGVAGPRAS